MFLRVKKKKLSNDRMSYHFLLLESYRENGKVKQKVIKYLSSFVDEYHYVFYTEQSRKDQHKTNQRLFFWLNIYNDLKEVEIDENKKSEIIQKIKTYIQFPNQDDLSLWIKHEWQIDAIFGHKYKEETQKNIDDVTKRFNEMCSDYMRSKQTRII